jgi:hypothetical protein
LAGGNKDLVQGIHAAARAPAGAAGGGFENSGLRFETGAAGNAGGGFEIPDF